jgi:hypothetical protein
MKGLFAIMSMAPVCTSLKKLRVAKTESASLLSFCAGED